MSDTLSEKYIWISKLLHELTWVLNMIFDLIRVNYAWCGIVIFEFLQLVFDKFCRFLLIDHSATQSQYLLLPMSPIEFVIVMVNNAFVKKINVQDV